jgi:tetratricopeptide (TPR) repeat protein
LATFLGPLEVDAALARCEEFSSDPRNNPMAMASILLATGALRAMKGHASAGRLDAERAKETIRDLDLPLALGEVTQLTGYVEMIGGDFARAENELRLSCELLQGVGEQSLLSTSAGLLAATLCDQGRYEEALEQTVLAERVGDQGDVATQELWRTARARCLAHAGDLADAERLVREGVALIAQSDFLNMRADAFVAQAEVFHRAGKSGKAERSLAAALELYEAKGNVVAASRARAVLDGSA